MTRTFDYKDAKLEKVPLLVGLVGPSFSGKTFSALRLATGMQTVSGGDIALIDTEQGRATHYHDRFKFKHVPFGAPFDPESYLAALEHCVNKGAKTVIVDSGSHCWEGPGGVLEMHESELDRMAGPNANWQRRDQLNFAAWIKPKQAYTRLVNSMLQMKLNLIWCFRAKEKMILEKVEDPETGKVKRVPVDMGFMSIAGKEMKYEFPLQCLLLPASGGVPVWDSQKPGEREMMKLPIQFQPLFAESKPLDEEIGEALAKWAEGDAAPQPAEAPPIEVVLDEIGQSETVQGVHSAAAKYKHYAWTTEQRAEIKSKLDARVKEIKAA